MTPEIPETRDYSVDDILPGELVHFPDLDAVRDCHRGWIAGPYVKGLEGIPFEVKYEVQQKGETRTEWAAPALGTTFVLVLSGSVTISYLVDGNQKDVVLSTNQSMLQSNAVPHKWVVNEVTTIITVRSYEG